MYAVKCIAQEVWRMHFTFIWTHCFHHCCFKEGIYCDNSTADCIVFINICLGKWIQVVWAHFLHHCLF